jgi:hypothetical protein
VQADLMDLLSLSRTYTGANGVAYMAMTLPSVAPPQLPSFVFVSLVAGQHGGSAVQAYAPTFGAIIKDPVVLSPPECNAITPELLLQKQCSQQYFTSVLPADLFNHKVLCTLVQPTAIYTCEAQIVSQLIRRRSTAAMPHGLALGAVSRLFVRGSKFDIFMSQKQSAVPLFSKLLFSVHEETQGLAFWTSVRNDMLYMSTSEAIANCPMGSTTDVYVLLVWHVLLDKATLDQLQSAGSLTSYSHGGGPWVACDPLYSCNLSFSPSSFLT